MAHYCVFSMKKVVHAPVKISKLRMLLKISETGKTNSHSQFLFAALTAYGYECKTDCLMEGATRLCEVMVQVSTGEYVKTKDYCTHGTWSGEVPKR